MNMTGSQYRLVGAVSQKQTRIRRKHPLKTTQHLRAHCAGLTALLFAITALAQPAPVRIMPLGDSITFGSSSPGGYRAPLYQMLTAAGFNVDFIGTQTGNGVASLPDSDHEGHGGWRIDQLDSNILGWFAQLDDPDVILLLIGTNDYGQDYDKDNATNRLEALIVKMATNRPYAKIIVANLLQRGEPYDTQIQTTFNPFVPGIVARQAALGRQVYFTDLRSALTLTDTYDNLYPNQTGYNKMATNWFAAISSVINPLGSTNAPALSHAAGQAGWTNVVVTFSKPVADDVTNAASFSSSGGVSILSRSLDPVSKRVVTLTTTPQVPSTNYTLTVSGVKDRTAAQRLIAPGSTIMFFSAPPRGAFANVPEAAAYSLVYSLNIPSTPNYQTAGPAYEFDAHTNFASYTRVAYYLELQYGGGPLQYVWVAMDPPSYSADQIGVPTVASGASFQAYLNNMDIVSSVAGVVTGTNLTGGNIEFWPGNYTAVNAAAIPGASDSDYDFGDTFITGNYGSMQIHNYEAAQTIFAFNRWGGTGGYADIGIGNGTSSPDWTFAQNAATYTIKTLQVFVLAGDDTTPPTILGGVGSPGWTNVVIQFSEPLADTATNSSCYSLDGGLRVLGAALDPVTKAAVTLTTTPQAAYTPYTVTVNNVRDRSAPANLIAANSTATFFSSPSRGPFGNVPEARNYSLVYSLDIPVSSGFNTTNPLYSVDLHASTPAFSRVAYYLELQEDSGPLTFVWVSMDALTNDATKIGVPTVISGASFQTNLYNMDVVSSVAGVATGTNLTGGNIEFWPGNYSAVNAAGIPGASDTAYDFGDTFTSGTYGSMQIHNYEAAQTILAFNRWGGTGGAADVGIGNGTPNPDWTFAQNAGNYTVRTLQVYVLPVANTNPPVIASFAVPAGGSNVVLTLSKPVEDSATNLLNFSITGGLTVIGSSLDPATRTLLTITTTPQTPGTYYTLNVSGLQDRTVDHLAIPPGASVRFMAAPLRGVLNNVPEARDYTMVYALDLPNFANWGPDPVPYRVDNHFGVTAFSRVAYYLELQQSGGPVQFLWVAMDPFTADAGRIGVPTLASGGFFQQPVSNLSVRSSVPGIVTGTGLSGGTLEFWPWNYSATNAANVPNASNNTLDWGDMVATNVGNHGSMQVANSAAGQILFALTRWGGSAGNIGIGIGNNVGNANPDWTFMDNAPSYSVKTLQVFVLPASDTNAPTIIGAAATPDRSRMVITFSEPLADTAADLANFSVNGGLALFGATLGANLREVTLTTGQQNAATTYTVTVNNVRDRSPAANRIAANSTVTVTTTTVPAPILANVPEAAGYQLVYGLNIPAMSPGLNDVGAPYRVDNRAGIGTFSRVGYYLEAARHSGPTNWIWVSADAFTTNVNRIGVPDAISGAQFHQKLTNMNVLSSVATVTPGTGLAGGNMEFWWQSYTAANGAAVANASAVTYDWGDTLSPVFGSSGYGSMQLHNSAASQVLFAYNNWGRAGQVCDLGIGSNTGNTNADYTFMANGGSYFFKNLYVLVLPAADNTAPKILRAIGSAERTNVLVTFNEPVADAAASTGNFTLSGGLGVRAATLRPNLREVLLTTDAQPPGAAYTLTVNGVRDRSANANLIAANSTANFTAVVDPPVYARVPEAANYTLVHGLALPTTVPNYNLNGITYTVDLRPLITRPFNRIAYYLELAANAVTGPTNWIYVSVDAFTTNLNRIGVPVLGTGAGFQQKLANLNVYSSVAGIITGAGITTGNIEFWPFNYSAGTNSAIPAGSNTTLDWNDTVSVGTGGQYGSMQIHNYGAGQVLFAFNKWGAGQSGNTDVGIGSAPGWTHPDWTFTNNAAQFPVKNLYVLVQLTNTPAPAVIAPTIISHPSPRAGFVGGSATLAALASGSAPLAYQWRHGSLPVSGQTNSWLTLTGLQLSDAGNYDVVASNSAGSATSAAALLTVTDASASVAAGPVVTNNVFYVQFTGLAGYTYIVQTATNILGPWSALSYPTAGPDGRFELLDPVSASAPSERYYRTGIWAAP